MPEYRGAVIENGRETQVCVGSLESVVKWAEKTIEVLGAHSVRISKMEEKDERKAKPEDRVEKA